MANEHRPIRPLPAVHRTAASLHPTAESSSFEALSPPPPPKRIGFHRSLQNAAFDKLSSLLRQKQDYVLEVASSGFEIEDMREEQDWQAGQQQDAFDRINATLARTTELSQESRRISADAVSTSADIRTFMSRYTTVLTDIIRAGPRREELVGVLLTTCVDLLAGDIFQDLFSFVEMKEEPDNAVGKWETLIASLDQTSNAFMVQESWTIILEAIGSLTERTKRANVFTFEADQRLSLHCRKVHEILCVCATGQVSGMDALDRKLNDITAQASFLRQQNTDSYQRYLEIETEIVQKMASIKHIEDQVFNVEQKIEDYLLQLVILSRGI